ncbi:MAG: hypothetical protein ACQESF_02810 [Nanobdellota archaeon]
MRFLGFVMFFFAILSLTCYAGMELHVSERGKVVSYYEEYYVVQVNGTITATNPHNSTLYNVIIPFDLGSLTIFEQGKTKNIGPGELKFNRLKERETKIIDYQIRGVTPKLPMNKNRSVLRSGLIVNGASLQPMLISKIKKSEVEKVTINNSKMKGVKNRRLITVKLENPSDTSYNVSSIKVLKTPNQTLEDEFIIDRWVYPKDKPYLTLEPRSEWLKDIIDYNVSGSEVYWLNTDIGTKLDVNLSGNHNVSRFDQEDLLSPENKTFDKMEKLQNMSDFLEHMMYVSKKYSDTHLNTGDVVDVDIKISNFAPINRNVSVHDFIPTGFELISNATRDGNKLSWRKPINPDSSSIIEYKLRYEDEDMLGVDYFEPTDVYYEDKVIRSKRTPFVRKYIPEKRLYVQKKVRSSVNDEFVVEITIQNVGETKIKDMYVKEFLEAPNAFREITKAPEEKGLWLVPELNAGEEWKVSYVTDANKVLNSLPQIFGVKDNTVLKTLILENFVKEEWILTKTKYIEIFGIFVVLSAVVGLVYLSWYRKTKWSRKFRNVEKQIQRLKKDTSPENSDSIDYLRTQAKEKAVLPDGVQLNPEYKIGNSSIHKTSKKASESDNKQEAKENLDSLKKIHEELDKEK